MMNQEDSGTKELSRMKMPIRFPFLPFRKRKNLLPTCFVTLMPIQPIAKTIGNTGSGFPSVMKTDITLTNSMDKTMTVKT